MVAWIFITLGRFIEWIWPDDYNDEEDFLDFAEDREAERNERNTDDGE